jgi:hypothetical protein
MAKVGYESVKHICSARRRLPLRNGADRGPHSRESNAALAQLVEHIIRNDGVAGSSPASGTTFSPMVKSSLGLHSASSLEAAMALSTHPALTLVIMHLIKDFRLSSYGALES